VLAGAAWLTAGVPSAAEWVRWLILAMLAIGYTEATSRIEVLYRYLSVGHGPMTTMVGVWAVPAALVLPTGLAALLNVVVTAHLLTWTARTAATRLHRELYTGATGVLATLTAAAIATASGAREAFWTSGWTATAAAGVVAAVLAYSLVNAGLVIAGMYAAVRPARIRMLLLSRDDFALDCATLVLGAFVATALTRTPWLTPAVAGVLVLLQRSALVAKLRDAAAQDSKTGLLNAATWEQRAARQLTRADHDRSPAAVLLLDLDHFKRINDTYGHLAGDTALRAVAAALTAELRGHDLIGRYGGEEFVVYLPAATAHTAVPIAERIRARIASAAEVRLTASVGIAAHPQHGDTITALLTVADKALYKAKHAGRDRVVIGYPGVVTEH
jgi:diguanylate cyclase (GGDEF)-like protein